jgi:hypothetical protein
MTKLYTDKELDKMSSKELTLYLQILELYVDDLRARVRENSLRPLPKD